MPPYIARPAVATGRLSLTAQGLVRVFRIEIEIESCERCGGKVRIIASVEDPEVIGKILSHLQEREQESGAPAEDTAVHGPRGPGGLPVGA